MNIFLIALLTIIIVFAPVVLISIVLIRITCNYLAKRIADELERRIDIKREVKEGMNETIRGIRFDAIARIFIAEAKKAEEKP